MWGPIWPRTPTRSPRRAIEMIWFANSRLVSCHRVSPTEYAKLVARMYNAKMAELFPSPADFILGLFGVWKIPGQSQRMLVDARPPNCMFETPPFVHIGGDSLSRMQVDEGNELEVAKADLKNFYHACAAPQLLQKFLVYDV